LHGLSNNLRHSTLKLNLDEDCAAGMRILQILNEIILLFSKNMVSWHTMGQAIHSLVSTGKSKTLHILALGPSQSNYLSSPRETTGILQMPFSKCSVKAM